LKKKILVIEQHFYPEVAATGQLLLDLCEDLVKAGYQVKVITGNPTELFQKKIKIPRRENYQGIEIVRLKNTALSKYNMAGRVINYLTFHLSIFFHIIFSKRPDLVLVLSNPPFISFHGLILKILKKCKVIYNVQDLFPDLAVELGKLRNKPFIFVLKTLSKYIIRKMDKVIVVGEYMERKIKEEVLNDVRREADHVVTIHNWADGEKLKVIGEEDNYLKKEWGLKGKFVILYSGNIGYLHEFDTIISVAEDIQNKGYKDVVFVFIGEGIKKEYIKKKAEGRSLNNFLFFPYQPRNRLTYSLGIADVSLVTLEKGFEGMVVPSKIYGILASGRPVIAVVGGESEIVSIIREGNCGKIVRIRNYQALEDGILKYYNDREKRREDGLNGRKYFEKNFDRKIATKKYIKVIEETLKS
jgi:glycosyltransferase involved in cell wall biosynthesis